MQNLKLYTDVIHTPLFRDATIVIFIWENVEGWPVVDVSENLEKLYGYKREDYIEGKLTFADQIHPDDFKQVLQEVVDASDDATESFQHKPYRYLDANGIYHWVSDNTSIIRDDNGDIIYYVGYLTHIDQYVRYNEKLLKKNAYIYKNLESSELKFRSIFENANDGILILKKNHFVELNQKAADFLNASKEYILNKTPAEISPEYQSDGWFSADKAKQFCTKVFQGENKVFDWQHLDAHGNIVNIEISLSLINKNNEHFILCIWRDISERLAMMRTIEQEKEIATNATKLKSRFLANMSHEIRTPMNGILGFIDILSKEETDPKKCELFEHIKNSGNTLLTIINDILDISKIESGKLSIESVPFEINELFHKTVHMYQDLCQNKDITLIYKEANLPYQLIGDSVRIKQVLTNFLSNALKFTYIEGTIILSVNYDETKELLECSVEDNGIGIHKERLKHVFNDFEQEDISTTRKYGGTGLGLSISRRLIELMDGEITVESEYKKGSIFSFYIPLKAIQKSVQKLPKKDLQTKDISSFNAHVLIVEDNATNQLLLSILLDDFGVKFDIANDGVEALSMIQESSYDLIFMDENMPNMNGIEATKKIRALEIDNSTIPIIALTANAISGDKERFLEAGMDNYISKPYDDEDIKKALLQYVYTS